MGLYRVSIVYSMIAKTATLLGSPIQLLLKADFWSANHMTATQCIYASLEVACFLELIATWISEG